MRKGDKIGCFARGGSLVAMFFSDEVRLSAHVDEAREQYGAIDFKLHYGEDLADLVSWGRRGGGARS